MWKKFVTDWLPYIIIIVVVFIIKMYVVTPIRVNGPSMNDTLKDGDIMFLNEIGYRFKDIERFDIIVVKYKDEYIIKRVIGLPGEKVSYREQKLYINGKYVEENFNHKKTVDFDEITVGEDQYFVMGDNRTNSMDSRIIGPVSRNKIRGKASLTILPIKRFGIKK